MKTVTSVVITLVAAMTLSPHAEQPIPPELQPSLAFLATVSKPMPDFHGVPFYDSYPDASGIIKQGIGHSDAVKGWFRQMDPVTAKFVKADSALRTHVDVYSDVVREEGTKVLAAATTMKRDLAAIDPSNEKVPALLALYNDEVKATRLARSEFNAASKKAEEATFLVEASTAGAKECNALLERSKVEAERTRLLADIEKDTAFLNAVDRAVKAVEGGPEGMVAYATGAARDVAKAVVIEVFHSGTRETLSELSAKLEAIDKSLADIRCKQQGAALKASKSNLESRMIQVIVAFGRMVDHRAKAWNAIDRLAGLKNPQTQKPAPFLSILQEYNRQVNSMGRTVFEGMSSYLNLLASEPIARGPLVASFVGEDIETVNRERASRDPSGAWISRASETKQYMNTYETWYEGELQRGQKVLADLREGRHLDFVDKMVARATKELGGTVSYDDIIRF
jgi:hypothetical protein